MTNKRTFALVTGFITLAVLSRILPHPYNFTPLGAIALFGAAYFNKWHWAIAIPLVAMWLSDLVINNLLFARFFDGFTLFHSGVFWIYGSLVLIALMGRKTLNSVTPLRVAGSAFGASIIFFLFSNFGVWASGTMYPLSLEGLIACYTAAVPFFHYTLAGDLLYSTALFGGFEYIQSRQSERLFQEI
ncbi:MAG: DUF6580 family putative transport protein [Bacteroidota bacterium]